MCSCSSTETTDYFRLPPARNSTQTLYRTFTKADTFRSWTRRHGKPNEEQKKDMAPASGKTGTNFHRNEYLLRILEGRGTRKQYVITKGYSFNFGTFNSPILI